MSTKRVASAVSNYRVDHLPTSEASEPLCMLTMGLGTPAHYFPSCSVRNEAC